MLIKKLLLLFAFRSAVEKGQLTWNMVAAGGVSGSITRQLTTAPKSSFVFDLEISGPMLKRSGITIQVGGNDILEIDTFAGGLSEYVGPDPEADPEDKDDEAPNAGMQLTLAGNQLRPFVFFRSSSDLMSLYWSGALEQKNPAIQVSHNNFALHHVCKQSLLKNRLDLKK